MVFLLSQILIPVVNYVKYQRIVNLSHYPATLNRVSPSTLTSFKATPLYTIAFVVLHCHI